jgi:hypothetical protein
VIGGEIPVPALAGPDREDIRGSPPLPWRRIRPRASAALRAALRRTLPFLSRYRFLPSAHDDAEAVEALRN